MKVVVDEGVPRQLVRALCERGIEASRFPRGWASLDNGKRHSDDPIDEGRGVRD